MEIWVLFLTSWTIWIEAGIKCNKKWSKAKQLLNGVELSSDNLRSAMTSGSAHAQSMVINNLCRTQEDWVRIIILTLPHMWCHVCHTEEWTHFLLTRVRTFPTFIVKEILYFVSSLGLFKDIIKTLPGQSSSRSWTLFWVHYLHHFDGRWTLNSTSR